MNIARRFGTTSSSREEFGNPAHLNDLNPWTWMAWVYPLSAGSTTTKRGRLMDKGGASTDGTRYFVLRDDTGNIRRLQANQKRATTNSDVISTDGVFEYNRWFFVACTYEDTDGLRMYIAREGQVPAEVTYATRTVGSGAIQSDAGNILLVGNNILLDRGLDAVVTRVAYCGAKLTPAEMLEWAYGLTNRPREARLLVPTLGREPVDQDLLTGYETIGRPFSTMPWPGSTPILSRAKVAEKRLRLGGAAVPPPTGPSLSRLERGMLRGVGRGIFMGVA